MPRRHGDAGLASVRPDPRPDGPALGVHRRLGTPGPVPGTDRRRRARRHAVRRAVAAHRVVTLVPPVPRAPAGPRARVPDPRLTLAGELTSPVVPRSRPAR